jgi:hypothetical protein
MAKLQYGVVEKHLFEASKKHLFEACILATREHGENFNIIRLYL